MRMTRYVFAVLAGLAALLPAHAQIVAPTIPYLPMPVAGAPNPYLNLLPVPGQPGLPTFALPDLSALTGGLPIPFVGNLTPQSKVPYTMRPVIPQATKRQMMQTMMPIMSNVMRMSMPDAMNWFAHKVKVKKGVSFDEVLESMKLRANALNFKYVGNNLMWKDFHAVLGDTTAPRIEVHSFCDIAVGRDLLKISPEFLVFLPCRIGIMEDANKDVWVMMLDWNLDWVAGYEGQMGISQELAKGAIDIRNKMEEIMIAGANGDL